jgi:hypothetical protein
MFDDVYGYELYERRKNGATFRLIKEKQGFNKSQRDAAIHTSTLSPIFLIKEGEDFL